jgi:biofilm PGA synthesis N-glycosyltransferase PgaC
MLASSLSRINHKPYVIGSLAILWGWVSSLLKRVPRFEDPEFRAFLRAYQWRILFKGKKRVVQDMIAKARASSSS